MKQSPYKPYQILIIVLFSMLINVAGRILADVYELPLWLDSFGTFLTAYALGPVCGAIVGMAGNILHGFLNPVSFIYSLTSVFIALIVGFMAKRGWLDTLFKTMSLSVMVTGVCVVISVVLNITFYDGDLGNKWGTGIAELFGSWGIPRLICIILGQFYIDFLDKVITLVALFLFIQFYRILCPYLPFWLKISKKSLKDEAESAEENSDTLKNLCILALVLCSVFAFPSAITAQENKEAIREESGLTKIDNPVRGYSVNVSGNTATENISATSLSADIYPFAKNYNSYASTIYNKTNGLSGGKTNDIASTNDGIIWIGTYEGLYRHNGNEFRLMNEYESIKAVRCLYVDDEGRLIVGTNDNGLSIIINESVMNSLEEKDGLPSDAVRSIIRASDGFYYVGTSEALAILSIADGLYVRAIVPEIQTAVCLSADENEHIAAVTASGNLYILQTGGRILYSSENQRIRFTACIFDQTGKLYASTEGNRIIIYSLEELVKTQERAIPKSASPVKISQDLSRQKEMLVKTGEIENTSLKHINSFKFYDDTLFLCADNGAGYIQKGTLNSLETGAFNNSIDSMTQDYQGNLWFTSSRLGLLKMCETSFSEVYASAGLPISVVNSTAKFRGNMYFATDDGLMGIDSKTGHALKNQLTEMLSGVRIRCLTLCTDGSMWISTKSRGIIHAKRDWSTEILGRGHQFRVAVELSDGTIAAGASDGIAFIRNGEIIQWITEDDGLENPVILTLSQTVNNIILAGTDGGGLAVIEKNVTDSGITGGSSSGNSTLNGNAGKTFEEYQVTRLLKRDAGLSSNVILRTVNDYDGETPTGSVFAVTSNGLCYIDFDGNTGSAIQDGATISDTTESRTDTAAQNNGTAPASNISIKILSNFPFSNNYDLVVRPNKNIFVLSGAGIFVVNRDELLSTNSIKLSAAGTEDSTVSLENGKIEAGKPVFKLDYELLDLKKGLRGSLTANSWNYLDDDGNLYLSCDTGASRINLNTYDKIEHSYRMQLKSVIIDGKRHIVQKDIPFVIQSDADTVELIPEIINYSINTPYISLYFEGIDEKPAVMLQSELQSSVYMNLKAGNYKFHIAVLDSKGRETVEEAVYTISKTYKIYNNWWFLLYTAGVAMLAIAWLTWFITSTIQGKRLEKQTQEMDAIKKQIRMGNETIFSIANAVEARDKSTGKHSFRVSEYASLIASELGFSEEELNQIRQTGLLHDIGKIGVPDAVLNKPDRLSDEEYEIMKTHTTIGGEILKDFTLIPHVDEGAKFHHERYDGTGYPNGLKGEEIPLNARIIGLADAFDAMTANRVYRKALDMDYVIQELKNCAGTQFDPGLVDILLELIENGKINAQTTLEKSRSDKGTDSGIDMGAENEK